jgi:hypothetical protein
LDKSTAGATLLQFILYKPFKTTIMRELINWNLVLTVTILILLINISISTIHHTKQLNSIQSKLDSLNSRLDIGIPIKE